LNMGDKFSLDRRSMLGGSAALGLFLAPRFGNAEDEPAGFDLLSEPSIQVRFPASVALIAIAKAGNRLVAVGVHGVVIYSDNNGVSWTQAYSPVNVTLTCVGFATRMIGWAAGHLGVILATTDGGTTWAKQLDGNQANQLMMQAARDPSVAANPCPCAPLALARADHFAAEGPDRPFLTMQIFSPQKIIVFGAYRVAAISNDGGKTWADWSLHIYDKYSHNIYDAKSVQGAYYIVEEFGLVFSSTDAGKTYLPLTPAGGSTLFGILGAADGSLITFGVAGACYRSTDGGKSWATLTLATQDNITGGRLLSSGALVCVTETGGLFKSTDNGVTFSAVSGVEPRPFYAIEEAASGDLIIVGISGVTRISKEILNA
jgi:photosystem II stability/assembly factor-like uncharacterized protein